MAGEVTPMRKLALAVALALMAEPVAAQINEADRLQRCQNNRDALALLAAEGELASEERIARLDRALSAANRATYALYLARVNYREAVRNDNEQGRRQHAAEERAELERLRGAAEAAGVYCRPDDRFCIEDVATSISNMKRNTLEAMTQARRMEVRRQIAAYRTNLVALRCDQARAPDVADIGGVWRSPNGSTYTITQSANQFSWTRSGSDERATGTISGATISARWASSQGSGGGSASIQFGPNGVPVQIRWSDGNVFTR
jgi:hypothetical protein